MRFLAFRRTLLAVALLIGSATPARASARPIDYIVTPIVTDAHLVALKVDMTFQGDTDGETSLTLTSPIADQSNLWRGVENFAAANATVSTPADHPEIRLLRHRPNATISVSYLVRQSFEGALSFDQPLLRPILQPDWFAAQAEGVFAHVNERPGAQTRFRWGSAPPGWTLASDAEQTPGQRGAPFEALRESVLIGGKDIRFTQADAAGGHLRVASIGAPGFDVPKFVATFRHSASAAATAWRDRGRDYFVAVIPIPAPPNVAGQLGWSRVDGFALYVTPTVDDSTLVHVVTHEYLHSWFPDAFGHLPPENFGTEAWFGEGFTDYYTDLSLLSSHVWSLEEFATHYNDMMMEYWTSPNRNKPGAELAAGFFHDHDLERMAYVRGALLAATWDRRIRVASSGHYDLRSVLQTIRVRDARTVTESPVQRLATATRRLVGVDLTPDLAAIASGADLTFPENLFGNCISVQSSTAPTYERGFPPVALGDPVNHVDPNGPAYVAGLRDGMIMLNRDSGRSGDSRVEQVWRVRDGAQERTIRFRPAGRGTTTFWDVTPMANPTPADRAACAAAIAGF